MARLCGVHAVKDGVNVFVKPLTPGVVQRRIEYTSLPAHHYSKSGLGGNIVCAAGSKRGIEGAYKLFICLRVQL